MMRLLCVGVVLSAVISARAIDIVGAMRSNADLTVYFDTTQAERAMSPEIWKRIQSDKGKARRRSGKKTFNTENRDAVGCVNVDFLSFAHFQFHLDGLLSVSGGKNASTRQDVRDFAAAFRELGYEVTESGGKKKPSCRASMTADGEHPDSGAEIVSENEGSLRIKAYWGVKEQDVAAARQKESRLADLLSADSVKGSSFVLVGDARTLAKLPFGARGIQHSLERLLRKLAAFRVSGIVRDDALVLQADLRFLAEKDVAEYRKKVDANTPELSCDNGLAVLRNLSSSTNGSKMLVTAELDLMAAWRVLDHFKVKNGKRR